MTQGRLAKTRRDALPLLCAIGAGLALAGCGGGGDGSVAASGNTGTATAPATTAPGTTGNASASRVGSASLSWNAPDGNEDGSALMDLAGYRVYTGTDPNSLALNTTLTDPRTTSIQVGNLVAGATHYFAVSAYTAGGQESGRSTVGSKLVN